jgi:hypothetical protein
MTIFDLLFIALFLTSVVTLLVAAFSAIRGRREKAGRILKRYGICFALYMSVVLTVAIAKPQKTLRPGDPECFDDWCITVLSAEHSPSPEGLVYRVALRISSRAIRVTQREYGMAVHLIDAQGRRFAPLPDPSAAPLDSAVTPGQSIDTERRFALPTGARDVGLVFSHGATDFFPGCFIIGGSSIVGKRTIVRLP